METTDSNAPARRPVYGKDQAFDVVPGMMVYGPSGEKIGRVTQVEGFGSTRLGAVPLERADERVTQAQSGTGFVKVNQEDILGTGAPDLYVPFRDIQSVTAEHDLILNSTVNTDPPKAVPQPAKAREEATRSGWQKWFGGKKS